MSMHAKERAALRLPYLVLLGPRAAIKAGGVCIATLNSVLLVGIRQQRALRYEIIRA